jgi:predicted permease
VANLLFARGVGRQREIALRLAIGASRGRLLRQLLTENLLLALVSASLAFGISRLVLGAIDYAITSTFPPDIGHISLAIPPADWRVILFLVGGAIASTMMFALAPALQATRLDLVGAMRGQLARSGRPGRARNVLIALQVAGSVVLLICAAIFLRSTWAAAAVDPGIRTVDVVDVAIRNESQRGAVINVIATEPVVEAAAASSPGSLSTLSALGRGVSGESTITYRFVSAEYFDVLGIDLMRGRTFTPAERSANTGVAVVSESVARQLWTGIDPIGQVLRLEPDPNVATADPADAAAPPPSVVVVGIARDVPGFRIGAWRLGGAGVYMPVDRESAGASLTMRVRGDVETARRTLVDRLAAIDPNVAEVSTLQTIARAEAYLLGIPLWLTLVLGMLALLLTLSGLFSVLSYLVEQRTKEIGVRMALGATRSGIAAFVISQSARPVAMGAALGASLTAALGAALLATPAADQIGSSVRLFDPAAYAAGLVWIVAACACAALVPALRAARIDPVAAIRTDV